MHRLYFVTSVCWREKTVVLARLNAIAWQKRNMSACRPVRPYNAMLCNAMPRHATPQYAILISASVYPPD